MDDHELDTLRVHGFGVAYRMLGSVSEAEDVAQEALFRLTSQDDLIDEPAAWVTTVATRLSINVLRSARSRRESYVGPWLPEPLVEDPTPGPAARAELADSLSLAMLVLLERLTPLERAAYLLREVFAYDYARIAEIIERSEVSSRQLVTRARKHLDANRPRFDADEAARDALLERFLAAAEEGDLEALEELLARDAVLYADSGGKAMAPQEPLFGAPLIARFMAAVARVRPPSGELESRRVRVNGQPGRLVRGPGRTAVRRGREARGRAVAGAAQGRRRRPGTAGRDRAARSGRRRRAGPPAHMLERPTSASGACSRSMSSRAGSRPCASCAIRTSSAISEVAPEAVTGRSAALSDLRAIEPDQEDLVSTVAPDHLAGTYRALAPSSFAFAVRHSGVFWYRGSFSDVTATLREHGDALVLEGSARVDSISVVEPAAMRASVLGPEFFDAERHPEIAFRSTAVRLAGDGLAEVDGELTIRGVTRPVKASGHYASPQLTSFGEVAGLQLHTSFDRRQFGFDWQMKLPGGGNAVGWDVEVDVDLLLRRDADAGE